MGNTVTAFEFLGKPLASPPSGVCTLFGGERFLKRLVLRHLLGAVAGDDTDFAASTFDASESGSATWADVHDELATRSLFGGDGPRVVVVDHADKFVSEYRNRLEDYLAPPKPRKSKLKQDGSPEPTTTAATSAPSPRLLVLIVDKWAANTRLYKMVDKAGMQIRCDVPMQGRSTKNRDDKAVSGWLIARAKQEHDFTLTAGGAQWVIDATDCEFGRMEQELQKLSLYADDKGKIDNATIKQAVGGWRSRTMWEAIDAATEGDADQALTLLDQLFRSGEHPLALFGQMAWSLRRYAVAADIVRRQLRTSRRADMKAAFKEAGFHSFGGEMDKAEKRIKQLNRYRASDLMDWLLEADLALKRTHSHENRGRLVLETLFVKMSKQLVA